MSSQNPLWQYQNSAEDTKKPTPPLPKPLSQQPMARPQQPNLLQQQYYNQNYDVKYTGAETPPQGEARPGPVPAGGGATPGSNVAMMRGPPYNQVPMPAYALGPGEMMANNYGNFQMPADQWEQFAMGVRHPIGGGGAGSMGVASVGGGGMSQLGSSVGEKKSRARARGSRGSLSSDSQDENGVKDAEFDGEVAPATGSAKVAKRSRMGCLTCRQRKKRCCETRPKCTECLRLRLTCTWPKPGTEHKNKPKEVKSEENTMDHDIYGKIKVLRGIVEYRSDQ